MKNYFHLLSLTPSPQIDLSKLQENYKKQAAKLHPDQGGNEQAFQELNTAYHTLLKPSSRLKHLLEINDIPYTPRGSISNKLMDLFMSTGALMQKAELLAKKKQAASSALSKALLETETLALQDALNQQMQTIEQTLTDTIQHIPLELEAEYYTTTTRDLTFLEKWQAQLQERFASLL